MANENGEELSPKRGGAKPMSIQMSNTDNIVVYALDAGGKKNFGWVRLDNCPGNIDNYIPIVTPKEIAIDKIMDCSKSATDFEAGENITSLANLIVKDLNDGKQIAIGVEAPMWFPIAPNYGDYRFDEEKGSSWSGQVGSTVSVQGIKRVLNLFDIIKKENMNISSTTDINHWISRKSNLFLFEGFINSRKYKIECARNPAIRDKTKRPTNKQTQSLYKSSYKEEHRWDAFLVACAFYGTYLNCNLGSSYHAINFKIRYSNVLSHWHSVMKRHGISIFPSQDQACPILAVGK